MKTTSILVAIIIAVFFLHCSKDIHDEDVVLGNTDSVTVPIKQCVTKRYKGDTTITYCLDSVINESRCPMDVICVWQGFATTKFSIQINSSSHVIKLSTLSNNNFLANDTTIAGFNFKLDALNPYPITTQNIYNSYKATLKIKRQ